MNNRLFKTPAGYSSLSVSLHWLMLVLIAATYALMELKGIYPRGSHGREVMATWHFNLGLTVFAVVWVRLVERIKSTAPEIIPPLPALQVALSKFVHLALYALMICLPVLGWLTLSAKGTVISFYGLELVTLVDKDKELFLLFKRIHGTIATLGYILIGLHALAALLQHYFKRDNTLTLMVPRLRQRIDR